MERQILVKSTTTRTELLVELMRESKGPAANVIINVDSVPHFLNTQVSLIVFSAMLKGYPKQLYWYSSSNNIINFLKSSNVVRFWKPPIENKGYTTEAEYSNNQNNQNNQSGSTTTSVNTDNNTNKAKNVSNNPFRNAARGATGSTFSPNNTNQASNLQNQARSDKTSNLEQNNETKSKKTVFNKEEARESVDLPNNKQNIQHILNKNEIEKELKKLNNPDFNNLDSLIEKLEMTKQALEDKQAKRLKEREDSKSMGALWVILGLIALIMITVFIAYLYARSNSLI